MTDKILDCQSPVGQVGKTDSVIRDKKDALEEFDRFCRFIDGINMNGFVENDFMSKKIQKKIRAALTDEPTKPSFRVPHEGYPFDAAIKGYGAPPKTTDDCHLTATPISGDPEVIWIDLTEIPLHYSTEHLDGAQTKYTRVKHPEWLPIESAPRDGTPFLAWWPQQYHFPVVVFWADKWNPWIGWKVMGWNHDRFNTEPTIWASLPPPPKKESE